MNNWQQDPRWKNIFIGDMTLGQVGCTSSVISNIIGITPDIFVQRMKSVNGFLGNLIIWAKIEEAFPGIKVRRVWTYNNADVLASVPNVIVEVPGQTIGGSGKHWIQALGNGKCNDPWTGKTRPTSDFQKHGEWSGYCVITGKWNSQNGGLPANYEDIIRKSSNWDEVEKMGIFSVQELKVKLRNSEKTYTDQKKRIYNALAEISG